MVIRMGVLRTEVRQVLRRRVRGMDKRARR